MIKWDLFFGNSSTEEALLDFVNGDSFTQFRKSCRYPRGCRQEIEKLRNRGYERARKNAKDALRRRGFECVKFFGKMDA